MLQERFEKADPRRELTGEEAKGLYKWEAIVDKRERGEKLQNREIQIWLSADEYAQIEAEWQEQFELREEFKDKPSDLKRYEEKRKQANL